MNEAIDRSESKESPVRTLRDAVREHILSVYHRLGRDKQRTASALGICLKTLYNRLNAYGVLD